MSGISRKFGLLCEGYDPDLAPEVAYVQQGNKVCFVLGERSLCESARFPEGVEIVESIDDLETIDTLDEATGATTKRVKDGQWVVEGPFQRSDTKNANGRTYPRVIWEKSVGDKGSRVQKDVRERAMVGHLEHPKDGRTDGNLGALFTRSLDLRRDGVVWGVAELLDTPGGLILQEYTRKGVKWGVSSRGNGSVDDAGRVNENDYVLSAFDGVMKPSTPGAYPKRVGEAQDDPQADDSVIEDTEPVVASLVEIEDDTVSTLDLDVDEAIDGGLDSHLTEQAAEAQAELTALCETEFMEMDASERRAFAGELIDGLSRVDSLSGGTLPPGEAAALQDWLTKTLKAVHESQEAEALVATTLDAVVAEDDDKAQSAFQQAVASLKARLDDAVTEGAHTRKKLQVTERARVAVVEAAKAKITEAYAARDEAQAEAEALVDAIKGELAEAKALLQQKEAELAIANDLVSDQSEVEVRDPVDDAVDEALEANPALAEWEDVLRNAASADSVPALVERLGAVVEARTTTPISAPRRALPRGKQVVSEDNAGSSRVSGPTSRGARMAGAAMQALTERSDTANA